VLSLLIYGILDPIVEPSNFALLSQFFENVRRRLYQELIHPISLLLFNLLTKIPEKLKLIE